MVRETVAGMLGGSVGWEAGLDTLTVSPVAEVDAVVWASVREAVGRLTDRGWQPAELHRVVARRGDPSEARLVVDALAARLAEVRVVDPRWLEQARELGAAVWWSGEDDHLRAAAGRWRVDRVTLLDSALALLRTLRALPPIDVLLPPPGTVAAAPATGADPRLLNRVRALLAKAEATDFPAEAESYTAKAQELIARYSLDAALAESQVSEVVPFARRIGVDHPYESEKASLLNAVARANRCHTVWSPELGFSTVFGFEADLAAVELVYTSLLVQSHRAMIGAEPRTGKARIKAFRRSFLIAYAVRIGERLEAVTASAALEAGGNVLPVLASRDVQVRETMDRAFPRTVRSRGFRVDSDEGWHSGRQAADRATLG
ncbi:DUF2786 domain-containing protein [Actinoplanes sp. NBRC 103695]|uniref:DUF2786 domain-containing protein n=1 Tax=Actinoplanes sp. NBRC 103695 TaxID=3032202 RepID=UPI0024A4D4C4|nr:DUF2786 domain-containing protein [Actinoplanes sp. NBRC 103695]GLZ01331.1 hypothetical protein Acsp02_85820 [Actinoplanes sp. NBRC 103695]